MSHIFGSIIVYNKRLRILPNSYVKLCLLRLSLVTVDLFQQILLPVVTSRHAENYHDQRNAGSNHTDPFDHIQGRWRNIREKGIPHSRKPPYAKKSKYSQRYKTVAHDMPTRFNISFSCAIEAASASRSLFDNFINKTLSKKREVRRDSSLLYDNRFLLSQDTDAGSYESDQSHQKEHLNRRHTFF